MPPDETAPLVLPAGTPSDRAPGYSLDPAYAAAKPATAGRSRRPLLIIGALGIVLALLAIGFVVWQLIRPRGGADSPQAAAEQVIDASVDQDPLALLDVVAPAETEGMDEVFKKALDKAREEKLISGDGVTDAVRLKLDNPEFKVEQLSDTLARVTLKDGDYEVSWNPEKLPDRLSFLKDESDDSSRSGRISELLDDEEDVAPSVLTEKVDGRWCLTLLGTAADQIYLQERQYDEDLDEPDWSAADRDPDPVVGKTPKDVVENLVDAVDAHDVSRVLDNADPDLARPLRPYVDLIQRAINDEGVQSDLHVSDLDLTTESIGNDRVRVTIEHGQVSGTVRDGSSSTDVSGSVDGAGCLSGQAMAYDEYYGDYDEDSGTVCLSDVPYLSDLGLKDFAVVLHKVDGGYQLDAIATATDYGTTVIDHLDDDLVDQLLSDWEEEVS